MYKQFSKKTRIELAVFRRTRDSITECAGKLGINYSTVWRELKSIAVLKVYIEVPRPIVAT